MNNYEIKTTLNIAPTFVEPHKMIYITKGASAVLNFNFADKVYSFLDTDQITFILKQNKKLYWYKMFTYLAKTMDDTVQPDKLYYTNIQSIEKDSFQCIATPVVSPEANPAAAGYYEEIDGNCSWRDTLYFVDPRFSQSLGASWDYVTLALSSTDTAALTPAMHGIEYEVVVRLNTDNFTNLANQDSIIIEPQNPITVLDSLYSKLI